MTASRTAIDQAADRSRGLQRVGRAMAARTESLAREMTRRITTEVPAYARAPSEVAENVLLLSGATAAAISAALLTEIPVRRDDTPMLREQAAHRVRQGIELDAFLHAYRAALFCYWDVCAEEALRLRLSRAASLAVGRFVLDSIDTITTHAAEAYLREDNRMRAQAGSAARDLIETLIAGAVPGGRARHPAAPGLDPTRPAQLIIGRVTASESELGDVLAFARDVLEQTLALGTSRPLSAIRQQEVVVITGAASPVSRLHAAVRRVREEANAELRLGVSDAPSGFTGIRDAYREAALTLSYATQSRPVVALDELRPMQLIQLAMADSTRRLIVQKAGQLFAGASADRQAMLETIAAFAAASMNVTAAAAALHVHQNTVRYRLDRIHATTGLDPRRFDDLADLRCIADVSGDGNTAAS